jgi:hypothetical protein
MRRGACVHALERGARPASFGGRTPAQRRHCMRVRVRGRSTHTRNTRRLAGWRWPGIYLSPPATCYKRTYVRGRAAVYVPAAAPSIRTWMAWALGRRRHRHLAHILGSWHAHAARHGRGDTEREREPDGRTVACGARRQRERERGVVSPYLP